VSTFGDTPSTVGESAAAHAGLAQHLQRVAIWQLQLARTGPRSVGQERRRDSRAEWISPAAGWKPEVLRALKREAKGGGIIAGAVLPPRREPLADLVGVIAVGVRVPSRRCSS
jgi:hypothetical protein